MTDILISVHWHCVVLKARGGREKSLISPKAKPLAA